MLQIQKICKRFTTGDLTQTALDNVSLNLRDNEFVAILGPSGSGKTTFLNIIGGLDRYDSGDLIINRTSTKKYKSRHWDSYRNHTIGFVFQSYNLIPHQSILANVELALTISGISRWDRKRRAMRALEQVGLADQAHKRPNQLSGGQMQRVAIARALINNPNILLADEPTGALDTETSIQVMELLKEVAKDRLVVMVTHNPELAEAYATRIVKLRDGKILDDSNPYEIDTDKLALPRSRRMGRSSMSFLTSLALSFNNLRTKKARTLLTAFAGSIGIIGIALILSLSTGVNQYVEDIQKTTMVSYPITVDAQTIDLSSMLAAAPQSVELREDHALDGVYSNSIGIELASNASMSIAENNLTNFKKYLDNPNSEIHQYLGENGIIYSYDVDFDVYTYDPEGTLVDTDGVIIREARSMPLMMANMESMMDDFGNFQQMLPGKNGALISDTILDNYDMLYGTWPEDYNEVVLVLNQNNEISLTILYELGLLPASEYTELMNKLANGEAVETEVFNWSYEDICQQIFYLVPACDQYIEDENGNFTYIGANVDELKKLTETAIALKIVGVIRPTEDASNASLYGTIGYLSTLTDYIIEHTDNSAVVQAQVASPDVSVLNGMTFSPANDEAKAADALTYLSSMSAEEKASLARDTMQQMYGENSSSMEMMMNMNDTLLAAMFDQYIARDPDTEMLVQFYDNYISTGSYDDNITAFGVVSLDAPSSISIYADSFEDKDAVSNCINIYNETASPEDQIIYTDYVGLLMSSVTTIVDVISYVLIAFVAVSLVVSSIMIGIITYISVLERTKEIGILRALGASKRNISQVFNAETFIIGLCSGVLGIGITMLLLIPINAIIHSLTDTTSINAILPTAGAVILVILSMVLTMIGGLIPSKKAAKKDPVTALRSE